MLWGTETDCRFFSKEEYNMLKAGYGLNFFEKSFRKPVFAGTFALFFRLINRRSVIV